MRAQSIVVLSNAQPYERGHQIYPKEGGQLYIPDVRGRTHLYTRANSKYMEILPIYLKYVRSLPKSKYVGEPHDPQNATLADNDSSYIL